MKLKEYENSFTQYLALVKPQLETYIEVTKTTGKFRDLKTRIVWDCYHAWEVYFTHENKIASIKFDDSVNDSHIESLAKKCLRNIGITLE